MNSFATPSSIHTPQPHELGHVLEATDFSVFFGNRRSERHAVARAFPEYDLEVLNQTHSDVVIESPIKDSNASGNSFGVATETLEADAHFTRKRKLALCIRTADCVPVMIFDPANKIIAAIHAGWRGIENEIIRKTCGRLKKEGVDLDKARVWIGPHIGASSFEVETNVAKNLEARFDAVRGYSDRSTSLLPHPSSGKAYVDLSVIARAQLFSAGLEQDRLLELEIDTFASEEHESFRRDRSRAGRQISFIALK